MIDHPASDWLRTKDAAARAQVDPGTLRRWSRLGWISTTLVGHCRYYSASDIDEVLEAGRQARKVTPFTLARPSALPPAWQGMDAWAARKRGAQ